MIYHIEKMDCASEEPLARMHLDVLYTTARTALTDRTGETHREASWIFTSNDIKVIALVIASSGPGWETTSAVPDLVTGGLIFLIVTNGARRILALSQ